MKNYSITLKWNNIENPTESDYDYAIMNILDKLGEESTLVRHSLEIDSNGKLHFHGIISSPKTPYMKSILKDMKGLHAMVERLKTDRDYAIWDYYITKTQSEAYKQSKIIKEINSKYSFIPNDGDQE